MALEKFCCDCAIFGTKNRFLKAAIKIIKLKISLPLCPLFKL
jgi:hypothetical protein